MAYADYDFYMDVYHGSAISEAEFDRLISKASAYLDSVKASDFPDAGAAGMAACSVAELWKDTEQGELQSQTVGKWSKTYSSPQKSRESRMFEAAALYLGDAVCRVRWC